MNFYKFPILMLLLLGIWPCGGQESKPLSPIVTKDSETTSVLGGWPPKNFGKGNGKDNLKNLAEGGKIETGLVISDTEPKTSPVLVAQSPQTAPRTDEGKAAGAGADSGASQLSTPPSPKPPGERIVADKTDGKPSPAKAELAENERKSAPGAEAPAQAESSEQPMIPRVDPSLFRPAAPPQPEVPPSDSEKALPLPLGPDLSQLPPLPMPEDRMSPAVPIPNPQPAAPRPKLKSSYTLGPGDTVTFSTYERADLNRTVRIAPDGSVSYLQAIAVNANGLTVDELRDRMEEELRKYRRNFKLIVTPQIMLSKQYTVLGRVQTPGSYPIDRPITVLEAIARAKGVEVGTIQGTSFQLADFEHSFVARDGKKLKVDFSKLYHEGDLSQNAVLQPDDYVYIASVLNREVYVLGAVNNPGRIKMPNALTTAGAITLAGGFQNEAYRMKVVVIRGDLETPEVHVVNMRDVVNGSALDISIQNRDIIFVPRRPFEMIERVVDSAITTYVQVITAEALNLYYNPITR